MTIEAWGIFAVISMAIIGFGMALWFYNEFWELPKKILIGVVCTVLIVCTYCGFKWYFKNTASGQRAMTGQKSNLNNGMERTITVYTADGEIIAQYSGKIDIEGNDGGYVLFDFDGKRYTYYNCFVESIANIN